MQAKHTSGPWTVAKFVGAERPVTDAGLYEVEEANEEVLDLFRQGKHREAEAVGEANRLLIQAAPQLFEKLEQLLNVVGLTAIKHEGQRAVLQDAVDEGFAVIAKAKGGAS